MAAGDAVGLPPGFELDPAPAAALPPGFELDQPQQPTVLEAAIRRVVEPNALQRRSGIRRARFKDENLAENIGSGFMTLGEDVGRETTGALAAAGLSPDAANLGGFIADAGTNFLPMFGGAKAGAAAGAPVMERGAKGLMQSALKPDSAARVGGEFSDAAKAIQTMLDEGINVSQAGAAKMRSLIKELHDDVASRIAQSPAVVDKGNAMMQVNETLKKFTNQVNNRSDRAAILKAWREFNEDVADVIPIGKAQELKQGTYKVLADKYAKGGLPAVENEASTQGQMAIARGLRQSIEERIPEVKQLNARESALINALEIAEKRTGTAGNRDIAGIAWLANNPTAAAAMLADRSPLFKSILARLLYNTREVAPAAAGAGAVAGAIENER